MGRRSKWIVRHATSQVLGCDLQVVQRTKSEWTWTVASDGQTVATGTSNALEAAQDAAEAAALRHSNSIQADDAQLLLF